jgi:CoA:oxalate CoA-transferase
MLDGAAQARGGLMSLSGEPGATPTPPGAAIADLGGAMQLALATMTGLFARAQHGVGQKVTTSALGAQLWLQMWELQQCIVTGKPLTAEGSHLPNIQSPYGVYQTQDGGAFMLAVAMDEESWDAICVFGEMFELVGHPDWDTPGKRMGSEADGSNPEEVRKVVARAFASKTTQEWTDFMYSQPNIIMERVRDHTDVLSDEQNIANNYVVPMDIPGLGESKVIGNLVQLNKTPGSLKGPAPELGADTAAVMMQLGFDMKDIQSVNDRVLQVRDELLENVEINQ